MTIKCVKIGEMDYGIDGMDVYFHISKTDENMTDVEARNYLMTKFGAWMEPSHIGGKFVSSIATNKMAHYNWECIGVVRWLYDV